MYKRTLLLNWNIIGTCQQLWLRLIEQLLDVGHLTLLHNCGHALSTTHYLFTQLLHLYYWFSTTEAYLCNGYFGTLEGYVTNQVTIYSFLLSRQKYFSFDLALQSFGTTFNAMSIFGWHSIILRVLFLFDNWRKRNLKPSETTKKGLVFSRNRKQY